MNDFDLDDDKKDDEPDKTSIDADDENAPPEIESFDDQDTL
jgi:hypothetical protein